MKSTTGRSAVLVDTSAVFAVLIANDANHARAVDGLAALRTTGAVLWSTSYLVCETISILASRAGLDPVREFARNLYPLLRVEWMDARLHAQGVAGMLTSGSRRVSLTDWASFALMWERDIDTAFTFDEHFTQRGFRTIP